VSDPVPLHQMTAPQAAAQLQPSSPHSQARYAMSSQELSQAQRTGVPRLDGIAELPSASCSQHGPSPGLNVIDPLPHASQAEERSSLGLNSAAPMPRASQTQEESGSDLNSTGPVPHGSEAQERSSSGLNSTAPMPHASLAHHNGSSGDTDSRVQLYHALHMQHPAGAGGSASAVHMSDALRQCQAAATPGGMDSRGFLPVPGPDGPHTPAEQTLAFESSAADLGDALRCIPKFQAVALETEPTLHLQSAAVLRSPAHAATEASTPPEVPATYVQGSSIESGAGVSAAGASEDCVVPASRERSRHVSHSCELEATEAALLQEGRMPSMKRRSSSSAEVRDGRHAHDSSVLMHGEVPDRDIGLQNGCRLSENGSRGLVLANNASLSAVEDPEAFLEQQVSRAATSLMPSVSLHSEPGYVDLMLTEPASEALPGIASPEELHPNIVSLSGGMAGGACAENGPSGHSLTTASDEGKQYLNIEGSAQGRRSGPPPSLTIPGSPPSSAAHVAPATATLASDAAHVAPGTATLASDAAAAAIRSFFDSSGSTQDEDPTPVATAHTVAPLSTRSAPLSTSHPPLSAAERSADGSGRDLGLQACPLPPLAPVRTQTSQPSSPQPLSPSPRPSAAAPPAPIRTLYGSRGYLTSMRATVRDILATALVRLTTIPVLPAPELSIHNGALARASADVPASPRWPQSPPATGLSPRSASPIIPASSPSGGPANGNAQEPVFLRPVFPTAPASWHLAGPANGNVPRPVSPTMPARSPLAGPSEGNVQRPESPGRRSPRRVMADRVVHMSAKDAQSQAGSIERTTFDAIMQV
jgi:hypothetical protein